jgi:hypothetical protein
MNSNTTLDSIFESRLIFLSAQPDDVYFHWQIELYLYQFSKHGILDNALFGYAEQNPSSNAPMKTTLRFLKIYILQDFIPF